jgi:hypothetical protein
MTDINKLKELAAYWSGSEVACMPVEEFSDVTGTPLADANVMFGAANALGSLIEQLEAAHQRIAESDTLQRAVDNLDAERKALKSELARRDAAAGDPVAYFIETRDEECGHIEWSECSKGIPGSMPFYTTPPAPSAPDGWKLVPVEPTEHMVIEGFESEPDPSFSSSDDWEVYEALSGCKQVAHKARLCWAAMLAAAPAPGGD